MDESVTYEIICVDDCSSDQSFLVCQDLAKNNAHIHVVKNNVRRGISLARNRALDYVKGEYIWFVDADDLIYPGTIIEFYNNAIRYHADMIVGNFKRVPESTVIEEYSPKEGASFWELEDSDCDITPREDGRNRGNSGVWGALFKREYLIRNNIRFEEEVMFQEDALFFYELQIHPRHTVRSDALIYLYRQRHTSTMHERSEERTVHVYKCMRNMLEVYKRHLMAKDYNDLAYLKRNIHRTQENITISLCMIRDHQFVRKELRDLKRLQIYPYPFRKETFKTSLSVFRKVINYFLPIEPFFGLHIISIQLKAPNNAKLFSIVCEV